MGHLKISILKRILRNAKIGYLQARLRHHPLSPGHSPILTRSRSAMAQFASEPSPSAALEEASLMASLSHTLTPTAPFASHSVAPGEPQFVFGHWIAPEPATEAVTVTTVRTSEVSLAPPSQGYVTFDTHPMAASIGLGSQPFG